MKLIQQSPNCSDFDVVLADSGTPAFRALLPENIFAGDVRLHKNLAHTIPGTWGTTAGGMRGVMQVSQDAEFAVELKLAVAELSVSLGVRNLSERRLEHVTVNICANANHLPGSPPWSNRDFIPEVPLDRDAQGRFWYERVTPKGLKALTRSGWVPMHPRADSPSAEGVPPYTFHRSERPDAVGCAALSHDGRKLFFQTWNVPCYHLWPFPGNACMHLHPLVAECLAPGQQETIRGLIGVFSGNWDALARKAWAFGGTP